MVDLIEGGCFCGKVRYAFEQNDYPSANCHCSICRRISAAPFVSWMVVPMDRFAYTQGHPKILHSTDHGTRYFCEACGTPLACVLAKYPESIDITTCSLDKPQDFAPKTDIYTDSKLAWVQ